MARDPEGGTFKSTIVDEQTKAAAMRANAAKAATMPQTDAEDLIAKANALKAKLEASVSKLESDAKTDIYGNPAANTVEGRKAKVAADVAAAQAATPKPELSAQQIADGFTIKWIGTTNGRWQVIAPSAATINANREAAEAANWSGSGAPGDPLLYKGKPFTGNKGVGTYKDGVLQTATGGNTPNSSSTKTTSTSPLTDPAELARIQGQAERQSAYDLLFQQFNQYGLGALVEPLKGLIISGASPAEFTIKLRDSDAYKKRFAANASRIANGLAAISEAEYLGLEDQYQNIMRNYGLPAEYYARGDMGTQEGFNKFIANDVSATELEDRIMTAQNRVLKANPEVLASLKQFYPDINNGDILAYTLDPTKGLDSIKRKVTAAEIGGGAIQAGLGITGARAEELGAAGITKQQAQQGFQTVAEVAPRGGQLAAIYGESPYTQQTAEQEVFGLAGSTEAAKQRKKLAGLEKAAFSGQTGAAQGALGRERAGNL